jgi:hypothetical protein
VWRPAAAESRDAAKILLGDALIPPQGVSIWQVFKPVLNS